MSTSNVIVRTDHVDGALQYKPFKNWLLPVKGGALLRKNNRETKVGKASGLIVRRNRISPSFLEHMEYPCTDTMDLALDIFDRHGLLQEEYLHHPIRRGLGIWQNELSSGNFLVIETVIVIKRARRQGTGRQLVMDMIHKATRLDSNVRFVFAYPTCLHEGEDLQERAGKTKKERFDMAAAQTRVAIKFFRELGFRRIGISRCFALSIDAHHISRTISIADDPDPPKVEPLIDSDYDSDDSQPEVPKSKSIMVGAPLSADGNLDYSMVGSSDAGAIAEFFEEKENRRKARSKYAQLYPIHHALQNLSDAQCLALLKEHSLKGDVSQADLAEIRDISRNNILHTAACHSKPECVSWILSSIASSHPYIKDDWNVEGYTPLEALQSRLDATRLGKYVGERFQVQADKFDGFADEAVSCMLALSGRPTKDDLPSWNRTRFGCTCGLCLGGFLSHRTRQSLQIGAEEILDILEVTETRGNRFWCVTNGDFLKYIPEDIQPTFKKSRVLRRGFRDFIKTVIECLQAGRCPTPHELMTLYTEKRSWPQMHNFYFNRGGSIEAAMNLILDRAEQRFEEEFDPSERDCEPLPALPRCRNDHEFGMVRRQCTTVASDDKGPDALFNERLTLQTPWIPLLMQMMESNS